MRWWPFVTRRSFEILRGEVITLMANLTSFSASFSQFATDFGQFKTDLVAYLANQKPENPDDQKTIDGFTQALTSMDSSVQQMDASLKPAPAETANSGNTSSGDAQKDPLS